MSGCRPGAIISVLMQASISPAASRSKCPFAYSSLSQEGATQPSTGSGRPGTQLMECRSTPCSSASMPRAHNAADVNQVCTPTRLPLRSAGRADTAALVHIDGGVPEHAFHKDRDGREAEGAKRQVGDVAAGKKLDDVEFALGALDRE